MCIRDSFFAALKARSAAASSLTEIPTNSTPWFFILVAVAASAGASLRHGGHQEPQTLTTTVLPSKSSSEIELPSRSAPEMSGEGLRSAGWTTVISRLPLKQPPSMPLVAVPEHPGRTTPRAESIAIEQKLDLMLR